MVPPAGTMGKLQEQKVAGGKESSETPSLLTRRPQLCCTIKALRQRKPTTLTPSAAGREGSQRLTKRSAGLAGAEEGGEEESLKGNITMPGPDWFCWLGALSV